MGWASTGCHRPAGGHHEATTDNRFPGADPLQGNRGSAHPLLPTPWKGPKPWGVMVVAVVLPWSSWPAPSSSSVAVSRAGGTLFVPGGRGRRGPRFQGLELTLAAAAWTAGLSPALMGASSPLKQADRLPGATAPARGIS